MSGVRGAEEDLGLSAGHGLHAGSTCRGRLTSSDSRAAALTPRARHGEAPRWEAGLETAKLFIAKEF